MRLATVAFTCSSKTIINMPKALFEILNDDKTTDATHTSIQTHLTRLLNARCGSLQHMPDYGLPDVAEIYQSLPYSIERLKKAVVETVGKYEPRLKNLHVKHKSVTENDCIVQLELNGQLSHGEAIHFQTYFLTGGRAKINSS